MINFLLKIPVVGCWGELSDLFVQKPHDVLEYKCEQFSFMAWGDPIVKNDFFESLINQTNVETVLKQVAGHFYYILQNKQNNTLHIGNSIFGILPVYYAHQLDNLWISDRTESFHGQIPLTFNPRFVLENILFNYPLFNISSFFEVNLLPVNNTLLFKNGNYEAINIFNIEELFVKKPISQKKSLKPIVNKFLNTSKKYYPNHHFNISLTGGFDGRTLVARALALEKKFSTYSFGSKESHDVQIAKTLANAVKINFNQFKLDSDFARNESLKLGVEFIQNAGGTASFSRAHYLYAAKSLSQNSDILITGNFGSEVFRAAHIAGAVISPNLYTLFNAKNYDEAIALLDNASEWGWLNKGEFTQAKQELYDDLKSFPAFAPQYVLWSKNQQFYKVVFDEVFRKYFGAEMVNQFRYLKNRTPFLDYRFLEVVLNSDFSGVHSDFFTHNPFKRFKGQVIYAHVLRETNPVLYKMMTDKGYRPSDILNLVGNLKITLAFVKKKVLKTIPQPKDPYGVIEAFQLNKQFWKNVPIDAKIFNVEKFKAAQNQSNSHSIALSQAWWYNKIKEKTR